MIKMLVLLQDRRKTTKFTISKFEVAIFCLKNYNLKKKRRNSRSIIENDPGHWNQKVEGNEVSFRNESISSRRSTRSGLLIQRPTNRILNVFSSSCEINGVILPVIEFSSKSISIVRIVFERNTDISPRRSSYR